jgi:hypothetical protein
VFRLFRGTFGKNAPETLTDSLLMLQAGHPQACLQWAFEKAAGTSRPNLNYATTILDACSNEGHGPRERRNGYAATKQSTDDVRFPASEGWAS